MVFRFTILSFVLIAFLPCFAKDQALPKKLTVTFEEYPPYEYSVIKGVDGHNIRKLKAIGRELGIELTFVVAPMTRGLSMTKNRQVDMVLSIYKTAERAQYLTYINEPLDYNRDRIFSHRLRTPAIIDSFEKLLPYKVGYVADNSYGEKFDTYPGLIKEAASYHADSILRLSKGRVPYMVMDMKSFNYFRQSLGLQESDYIQHPLEVSHQALHMAFSKDHPHREQLLQVFSTMLKKYADYQVSRDFLPICQRHENNCGP